MPSVKKQNSQQVVHSPAIQAIITSVPSWLLRWGIFMFFVLLILIAGLSAFIKYPDLVITTLKIDTSADQKFYGQMAVPQNMLTKVKEGQEVLIKLRRYPYQTYGTVRGTIKYIDPIPQRDSIFISKVDFNNDLSALPGHILLKDKMMADAEIITQDVTILQRLSRSIFKSDN